VLDTHDRERGLAGSNRKVRRGANGPECRRLPWIAAWLDDG